MKLLTNLIILLVISMTQLNAQQNVTQSIVVKVTNFDNDKGKVFVALYNSEASS